jgi:amino-acid N-acetyltransferase
MEIRKATDDDWSDVLRLIRENPEQLMQDHLPRPKDFFVAEETDPSTGSGRVVGCCALEIYSERLSEVRSLAIAVEYRGKGIASQLVQKCVDHAKEKGVYEVLAITSSLPFFEKQGFNTFHNEKYALLKILG